MHTEVRLFSYTKNVERVCASAMRSCYSAYSSSQLFHFTSKKKELKNEQVIDEERVRYLIRKAIELGHHDILEHGTFTFDLRGISRACSHQLVRHRIASYSQQSQRYVKITRTFGYIKPPSLEGKSVKIMIKGKEFKLTFEDLIDICKRAEEEFIKLGVKAEDARYIRPNASITNIVVTMNPRELLHVFSLRCALDAQWEIRDVAWAMYACSRLIAPTIFETIPKIDKISEVKSKIEKVGKTVNEVRKEFEKLKVGEAIEIPLDTLNLSHNVKAFVDCI